MENWSPPPYDEPYWPGYEYETSFLSRHLIQPDLYPIVYLKGRNPEPILLGNESDIGETKKEHSSKKRKLGGSPHHLAVKHKFGDITDKLVEMAVRNELVDVEKSFDNTDYKGSEPEIQIT